MEIGPVLENGAFTLAQSALRGAAAYALNNPRSVGEIAGTVRNLADEFAAGFSSRTRAPKRARTAPSEIIDAGYQATRQGEQEFMKLRGPYYPLSLAPNAARILSAICPLWKYKHSTTGAYSAGTRGRQTITSFEFHNKTELQTIFTKLASVDVENLAVNTANNNAWHQHVKFCGGKLSINLASRGDSGVFVDIIVYRVKDDIKESIQAGAATTQLTFSWERDIADYTTISNATAPVSETIDKSIIGQYPGKKPSKKVRRQFHCFDHQKVYIKEGQWCTYTMDFPAQEKSIQDWLGAHTEDASSATEFSMGIRDVTYVVMLIHHGESLMNSSNATLAAHKTALEYQYDITEWWRRPPPANEYQMTITGLQPTVDTAQDVTIDVGDDAHDATNEF